MAHRAGCFCLGLSIISWSWGWEEAGEEAHTVQPADSKLRGRQCIVGKLSHGYTEKQMLLPRLQETV